ncbi:shufflon system plasmid conjugative transfer pilus tip adhesin PilV [Klebsiella michiganensis]|uniref:shufflon system plasmid conjugative transfer pilus tip adhesin PilV n=1 Tax=Klebsiella michiganensis TaxID=1134687 RepID=UPI003F50486C
MTNTIPSPVNRGMSLTSMSIVMAIVLIAAPLGYMRYAEYMNERIWDVTASHMDTVTQAGRHYIRDNHDTLVNQVKNGKPVTVSVQTLLDQGYLPSGFSQTNFNSQTYQLNVVRDPKNTAQLAAFVLTTGGQPIEFKGLRYISQGISGMGGYLYPDNVANGADGGWQMKLSDYGLSGKSGHLADWLSADILGGDNDESDRLYRFQVNGRPDMNRMHTNLDMGSNAVSNASTVTASNDIKTTGGWVVTDGSKGWMNETHGGGLYMDDDSWIKSVNNKGIFTGGQLKGGSVRADGRLSTGDVLQLDKVNVAGTVCDTNGLMSRDSNGSPLSCINGLWTTPGNGWQMPPPQTVSCSVSNTTFKGKIDADGKYWSSVQNAAINSGWVRGQYVGTVSGRPIVSTITLSGLTGQATQQNCHYVSHMQQICSDPELAFCYAPWKF